MVLIILTFNGLIFLPIYQNKKKLACLSWLLKRMDIFFTYALEMFVQEFEQSKIKSPSCSKGFLSSFIFHFCSLIHFKAQSNLSFFFYYYYSLSSFYSIKTHATFSHSTCNNFNPHRLNDCFLFGKSMSMCVLFFFWGGGVFCCFWFLFFGLFFFFFVCLYFF